MANIVFGFGTAHGPLLSTPPDKWDLRGDADRQNPAHPFKGEFYTFDELYELRKGENLAEQNTLEVRTERYDRCQNQVAVIKEKLAEVDPDVLLVVGDDQHEWFQDNIQPTFTIYHGDEVANTAFDEEKAKKAPPGIGYVMRANSPDEDIVFKCEPDLADHIIAQVIENEFDVTASATPPIGPKGPLGMGHAFGYIYEKIVSDQPPALVPILINTFFPPNQATSKRCYEFGRTIGRAIKSWNSYKTVAVAASGGLSHFVIDEEFDNRIIEAFNSGDVAALTSEPEKLMQSGTSETKNWIVTAGIIAETELKFNLLDYVPCYRTDAGTGNAMAFSTWT